MVLQKEVSAQGYTTNICTDDLNTVAASTFDNMLKERYDTVLAQSARELKTLPLKRCWHMHCICIVCQASQCAPQDHLPRTSVCKLFSAPENLHIISEWPSGARAASSV